ncbi:MAG: hypothetical protein NZ697_01750, partial [Porticoccaceae bacterium]|nr:hypothetical protein [Porticoccaceae bacterium]
MCKLKSNCPPRRNKFVRPGAQRVSTSTSRSVLLATSFINEDNRIATIVMNET